MLWAQEQSITASWLLATIIQLESLGWNSKCKTHLQIVEVTHGVDPVHQQGDLGAAVLVRRLALYRTRLKTPVGPQARQPPLGPQGSPQEANFLFQLFPIQNHLHLKDHLMYSISINSFPHVNIVSKCCAILESVHTWNAKMIFHKRLRVFSLCPSTMSLESMFEPGSEDTNL